MYLFDPVCTYLYLFILLLLLRRAPLVGSFDGARPDACRFLDPLGELPHSGGGQSVSPRHRVSPQFTSDPPGFSMSPRHEVSPQFTVCPAPAPHRPLSKTATLVEGVLMLLRNPCYGRVPRRLSWLWRPTAGLSRGHIEARANGGFQYS